jgi:transposase-like protein
MPKPYPPQFRRQALDLVASGRPVRDVAAVLQIAESCLHRWRQQDLVDRGLKRKPGKSPSSCRPPRNGKAVVTIANRNQRPVSTLLGQPRGSTCR